MKKIMFNDRYGLTQAVLNGRKTMTRRIIPGCYKIPRHEFEKIAYIINSELGFEKFAEYGLL